LHAVDVWTRAVELKLDEFEKMTVKPLYERITSK